MFAATRLTNPADCGYAYAPMTRINRITKHDFSHPRRGRSRPLILLHAVLIALVGGCKSDIIKGTDRSVYDAIADRQKSALGTTSDVRISDESGHVAGSESMYSFTPHPQDGTLPDAFRKKAGPKPEVNDTEFKGDSESTAPRAGDASSKTGDIELSEPVAPNVANVAGDSVSPSIFSPDEVTRLQTFGLKEVIAYALRHGREIQDAKEDLYIAALDLTLERHLWTPQFVGSISAEFADYGQIRDFDRAMTAVSDFAVTQKLPYGGDVTARVINTLMRDLGVHTTSGETGNFILEANLPLFRGAGKSAYESRFQAERDLIYAVRDYERFRRSFIVTIAAEYFNLQRLKSAAANSYKSYVSRKADWEKADFIQRMGQSKDIFEAPRAQSSYRRAESSLVSAKEQYASALDRFKITIGMPVDSLLDVVDQEEDKVADSLDDILPDVEVSTAIEVAERLRLDLLNSLDRVDDSRRQALVAQNRILPDLDARGSVTLDTDPSHLNSTGYNTERTTWRGGVELRMDDRKRERNAYRQSLIAVRKSERDYDRAGDEVRAGVRRAVRRIEQQASLRLIQKLNVEENELRLEASRAQFNLGRTTNQDVVDAEDDLLTARNDYAAAVAAYRIAVLEFRRDTETLRVNDNGDWEDDPPEPVDEAPPSSSSAGP